MVMSYHSELDAFDLYHQVQEGRNGSQSSSTDTSAVILRALSDGLSGSVGAAISNIVIYPLDLIITRFQIQRQLRKNASEASEGEYTGFLDAVQKILKKDGWTGFYTGLPSDTGKTLMDSFLFFLMYDFMRKRRLRAVSDGGELRKSLPVLEELSVGFIAGSLTKLCTTPIANIVTRKQTAALTSTASPSTSDIVQNIMEEKGALGFWSGYSASLVLTLNPSITFFLFETLKRLTLPRSKRESPPSVATFFLAAISKTCASSITYPFSLAKARLQSGNSNTKEESPAANQKTIEKELPSETSKATKKLARTSIFSTLLTISRTEGVSALYEGLHLEITKAFFSHGTTMLVKQAISRLLLRLYYTARIVFTDYREGHRMRLAQKAKASGHEYYDLAIKRSSEKFEDAKRVATEQARRVKEAAEFVGEYVDETVEEAVGEGIAPGVRKVVDGVKGVAGLQGDE